MGKYALLIGVSTYGEGLQELPAASKDVVALQEVLQNPEMGDFDEVKPLVNPTQPEMAEAIEEWFQGRKPEDLVLLFFSGHGVKDDRRKLYFAAANTKKARNRLVRSTATPARFIHDCIQACKAKYQVLILDCCFSGAFGDLVARDDGEIPLEEELGAEGRVVLTSTSGVDYSFEEKGRDLSIYTRYLVEGISSGAADEDGDGVISIDELHNYAERKVQESVPVMRPTLISLKDQGYRIHFARSPLDDPKLKYRKEAERRARSGGFSIPAQRILSHLRVELQISDPDALAIEDEVLKPHREYQCKQNEYQDTLRECLKQETPLSPITIQDLRYLRGHLGLKPEDIASIERVVLQGHDLDSYAVTMESQSHPPKAGAAPGDFPPKKGQTPIQTSRRGFLMLLGLGGLGLGGALLYGVAQNGPTTSTGGKDSTSLAVTDKGTSPGTSKNSSTLATQSFSFNTVRVDERGEVVERLNGNADYFEEDLGNGVVLDMVMIPGGTFTMGSPSSEAKSLDMERPQHEVRVPSFAMGRYVVTQSQWQAIMGNNPSEFKGDGRPVERVNWNEAVEFCEKLSAQSGKNYRLPSEAEWEYACRAGTTTPFHFGETITPELVNYDGNYPYAEAREGEYREQTTEVGSFPPNANGLYDMHGNVWEWCLDHWHDNYNGAPTDGSAWVTGGDPERLILRGGSWAHIPRNCRSAFRDSVNPDIRSSAIGFRVSCSSPRSLQ